jgi:hypothetical protein
VFDSKVSEELFGSAGRKFFSLVCDEVDWHTNVTDPVVKDGSGDGGSFLVGQCNEQDVLGEGVHDAYDILFSCGGGFERQNELAWPFDWALWAEEGGSQCFRSWVLGSITSGTDGSSGCGL